MFEGHNDWEVVEIRAGENTGDDQMEDVYATVLESITDVMASEIEQGRIGAVSTVDDKYYLLQWTSLPYCIEDDQFLTKYDPPIHVKDGELVCEGQYLGELMRANKWYYPTKI
jgi:SHS2 domain-containing protein